MNRRYKRWTQDEKDNASSLLALYTIEQVAQKLNRTYASVKELASTELKHDYCRSKIFRQSEGLLQSEVAQKLGVSRSHINNWINMNKLPTVKCGKKGFYVIKEKNLFDWLRSGYVMLPPINPRNDELKKWVCNQRTYFLQKYISSKYIRHTLHISRGALDNWVKHNEFPKSHIKIGKVGTFYDRKEVIDWARKCNIHYVQNKIVLLNSYGFELDFLNNYYKYKCI